MALRGAPSRDQRTPQRGAERRQPAATPRRAAASAPAGQPRQAARLPGGGKPPGSRRPRRRQGRPSDAGLQPPASMASEPTMVKQCIAASLWVCRRQLGSGKSAINESSSAGLFSLHAHHIDSCSTSQQGSAEPSAHLLQRRGRVWHAAERRHCPPVMPRPLPCVRHAALRRRRRSLLVSAVTGLCCRRAVGSAQGRQSARLSNP